MLPNTVLHASGVRIGGIVPLDELRGPARGSLGDRGVCKPPDHANVVCPQAAHKRDADECVHVRADDEDRIAGNDICLGQGAGNVSSNGGQRDWFSGHLVVDRVDHAAVNGNVLLEPSVTPSQRVTALAQVSLPSIAEVTAAAEAEGLDHDTLQARGARGRFPSAAAGAGRVRALGWKPRQQRPRTRAAAASTDLVDAKGALVDRGS